jgi:hypothetical protein
MCRYGKSSVAICKKYKLALSEIYARIKSERFGILGYAAHLGHMKKQQLPNIRPK